MRFITIMVDAASRANLLRQVEFYMSDQALPYDEFFKKAYDEHGAAIPLDLLAGSPRIVKMLDGLAAEARQALIAEVVKAESDSVRIVDDKKVGRIYPLPAEDPKAICSVYLSGCAKNLDEAALRAQLEGARAAHGAHFLPIVSIRRLRDLQRDRAYSGQLIIECEDAEKADALLKAACKGACGIPNNKAKLLKDFFDKQHACALEQREKIAAKRAKRQREGGDEGGGGGGGPPAEETAEQKAAREVEEAAMAEAERLLVIRFEGAGPDADREAVQALVEPHAKAAYINFSRGDPTGHVRFETAASCKAVLDALGEGGTAAGAALGGEGTVPTWRMLTPSESAAYWAQYREKQRDAKRQKKGRGGGGKGGGGKGGKGKGRGGKGGGRGGGR